MQLQIGYTPRKAIGYTPIVQPTADLYGELQSAYNWFNGHLFEGKLPQVLLTVQRKDYRVLGYYCHERFEKEGGKAKVAELAMNPMHFHMMGAKECLATLVHEMCHVWQFHFGSPGRRGYHNKEWGDKMEACGLMPSNTSKPGGKKTGEQMHHYVIEGGAFEQAFEALGLERISWADRALEMLREQQAPRVPEGDGEDGDRGLIDRTPLRPNKTLRVRYTCPGCGAHAWGKPNLWLVCGKEGLTYQAD